MHLQNRCNTGSIGDAASVVSQTPSPSLGFRGNGSSSQKLTKFWTKAPVSAPTTRFERLEVAATHWKSDDGNSRPTEGASVIELDRKPRRRSASTGRPGRRSAAATFRRSVEDGLKAHSPVVNRGRPVIPVSRSHEETEPVKQQQNGRGKLWNILNADVCTGLYM